MKFTVLRNLVTTISLLLLLVLSSIHSFAQNLTYSELKLLIQKNNIRSVEELLPQLPETYLNHYSLMYHSRSLQAGSEQFPRVLLFGERANFIMSFNGSIEQKGYFALETMEYDSSLKSFSYREIQFPDLEKDSKDIVHYDESGAKCMLCHGNPARPIWDATPLWPGAYGAKYLQPLSSSEKNGFNLFLSTQKSHARYKYLIDPERFARKEILAPKARDQYLTTQISIPNESLTMFLHQYNIERLVHLITQAPNFNALKASLFAALENDCDHDERFLPPALRAEFNSRWPLYLQKLQEDSQRQQLLLSQRISASKEAQNLSQGAQNSQLKSLAYFMYLAENGLGIAPEGWSSTLELNGFDFPSNRNVKDDFKKELLRQLSTQDTELVNQLNQSTTGGRSERLCRYLEKQSTKKLSSGNVFSGLVDQIRTPLVLDRCNTCHQGVIAPAIPFKDPKSLALLLNQGHYRRGNLYQEIKYRLSENAGMDHMPFNFNLSPPEVLELENYFSNMAKPQVAN